MSSKLNELGVESISTAIKKLLNLSSLQLDLSDNVVGYKGM